jgi:transglutaminase superfamily protein
MARLRAFYEKPPADRRLLLLAAVLHGGVAIAIRVLPFGWVRRGLRAAATFGPRPAADAGIDARVVRAVQTVASILPGSSCLTEALVAQCLLARHAREATLCFGVSPLRPDARPFDAHAWLERRGSGIIGARAIAYDPLRHPSRCASSPSSR